MTNPMMGTRILLVLPRTTITGAIIIIIKRTTVPPLRVIIGGSIRGPTFLRMTLLQAPPSPPLSPQPTPKPSRSSSSSSSSSPACCFPDTSSSGPTSSFLLGRVADLRPNFRLALPLPLPFLFGTSRRNCTLCFSHLSVLRYICMSLLPAIPCILGHLIYLLKPFRHRPKRMRMMPKIENLSLLFPFLLGAPTRFFRRRTIRLKAFLPWMILFRRMCGRFESSSFKFLLDGFFLSLAALRPPVERND